MQSIRRWLLLALLALLAVAAALGGVLTYGSARAEVDQLLDEELRQVALSLRDHARLDTERIARSAERPEQRLLVQVDDPRRAQPYRSRDVAPLPPAGSEGFRELDHSKDNASYVGLLEALEDARAHGNLGVPLHLRNAVTSLMKGIGYGKGYRYVHDDPQAKVEQAHLPNALKGRQYYRPKPKK